MSAQGNTEKTFNKRHLDNRLLYSLFSIVFSVLLFPLNSFALHSKVLLESADALGGNPVIMVDVNGEDWYKTIETNDDGEEELKYHFTEEHRSQAKARIKGEYLEITYQGNNFYLSLLGDKFEITNKESLIIALMVKNIDKAIENHHYDLFKNRQKSFINTEVSETLTDMNIYLNGKQQNVDLKKKIPYYFNYAGGKVEYNVANHLSFSRFNWGDGVIRKK